MCGMLIDSISFRSSDELMILIFKTDFYLDFRSRGESS